MNINSIFGGLLGYESVMLICGFVLFVFALAAITVMIVQRRSFKALIVLFLIAIVLMGFPGIAAVKFNNGVLEIDALRSQPPGSLTPQQQQQYADTLSSIQQRAAGQPQVEAKVADGYRAIGDTNRAYALAQSLLAENASATTRQILVPVLTAKLDQAVRAATPATATTPAASATPAVPVASAAAMAGTAPAATPIQQHNIAAIASQLQAASTALPATSHAALARAYVALGDSRKAQANVAAARRLDPGIRINAPLRVAPRIGHPAPRH